MTSTLEVSGAVDGEIFKSVTLVGHSYAGMVITGVAERESGRLSCLSRLIYVDAFVPDDVEETIRLKTGAYSESGTEAPGAE